MKRDWDVVREVLEAVESGDVAGYIRSEGCSEQIER